jgi:hypothetical protein
MSEEGRGGNHLVNQNAARQTARAMLHATRRKSAICPTGGSGDHPVLWRSVGQTSTTSNNSVLEGRKLGIDTSNKYSNDTGVKFKRIIIAKTATIKMMKHNIR